MDISAKIEAWRNARGVGIAELARRVGVSTPTAWRWCRGKGNPTLANLGKLCAVLGVDLGVLLTIDPGAKGGR